MEFETISVVGLGYIGLPTAAIFASRKKQVIGVDVNQKLVDTINRGDIHLVEPDLDMVVHAAVTEGYLKATTIPEPADAFIIAVPTPTKGGHEPDLSYIEAASKSISRVLKKGDLVVLESTSPVGATEQMSVWLAAARTDLSFPQNAGEESDIRIAHCPERVLPGYVLRELVLNDRVIGGMTPNCSEAAASLYKIIVDTEPVVTKVRTAEMTKLVENSFRDVNIAFANELSIICDKLEIDVWELIRLANRHPRVNILQPGPGVGGHCIAVDPWCIVHSCPKDANLITTARQVNDAKPEWVIEQIEATVNNCKTQKPDNLIKIACFGLTFKADIDDLRDSPALDITNALCQAAIGTVWAVEPFLDKHPDSLHPGAKLVDSSLALKEADILVLLVDHRQFREVSPDMYKGKIVIDTRGAWSLAG